MGEYINAEQIKKNTKEYTNQAQAFRALLGGIGTGNISLDAAGRMCDFEIHNHPDKKLKIPYTFFSLWSKQEDEIAQAMVLEAAPIGVSDKALGHPTGELIGLPRFDKSRVRTQYPFYYYEFEKEGFYLDVTLEAYTPFIPLDSKNSGIPGFCMKYRVTNKGKKQTEVSICSTMYNDIGFQTYDGFDRLKQKGRPYNLEWENEAAKGILFCNEMDTQDVSYGTMALACENSKVTVKPQWQIGSWWDGAEEFWQDFREDGELKSDVSTNSLGSNIGANDKPKIVGSVAGKEVLQPGETKEFVFYFTWNFPNRYGWWPDGHADPEDPSHLKVWKNYYSTIWNTAEDVLKYFIKKKQKLWELSRKFTDVLYSTTLDKDIIESLVSAITVLRSNTCFRIADGHFFAWEGCFDHAGSCAGTCTHVWNYAQALAYLFPELEISARKTEFLEETDEEGNMAFRAKQLLDGKRWDMLPATDGQLGSILRVYREWMLTGDRDFLKAVWNKLKDALEFSLRFWDQDQDGVLDSQQHNTYDIEFYGLNSLTNSMLYAALEASARLAEELGEVENANRWRKIASCGSKKMDELLWNGEYYQQKLEEGELNKYKYQYGDGCLSDQVLGQELAHVYGLGYVLPEEHIRQAVASIYKYNFRETLKDHESVQRAYAYQDEGGLLLCSWPKGGRPKQPFVYSDEIWTGIEYQVAVHLIYEGMIDEALHMVKAIRKRYDGMRRSPYDELECGHHYTRSMAAWGLLIALSGYECNAAHHEVSFHPRVNQNNFTCFYSNGNSWGIYHQEKQGNEMKRDIIPVYEKEEKE